MLANIVENHTYSGTSLLQIIFGMEEKASSANESPSFNTQGLAVSREEIPIHFVEYCPTFYHSFIKPWRIVYEEAPADARSCQQHVVHSDSHCAGEHG